MKFTLFATLVASTSAFAPVAFAPRSNTAMHASIAETLKTAQGPHFCWGSDGPTNDPPHDENEIKGYDNVNVFAELADAAGVDLSASDITVIAPVNSCFDGKVDALKADPNLKSIIEYHCLVGKHTTSSIGADIATVNGKSVTYERKFRKTFLDDTIIGQADNFGGGSAYPCDIACDNGVVHMVSTIMDPSFEKLNAEAGLGGVV